MSRLVELDPRLAGYDERGPRSHHTRCQFCQASEDYAVIDRYICNEVTTWLCDDCACDADMDSPEAFTGEAIKREIPTP